MNKKNRQLKENSKITGRKMFSSISFQPKSSSCLSTFFFCPSRETEALIGIRLSACVIQRLLGRIGMERRCSLAQFIWMKMAFFPPGMSWGHSSTYAPHVRTYQDSAGGICVCVLLYGSQKDTETKMLLNQANTHQLWFHDVRGSSLSELVVVDCLLLS